MDEPAVEAPATLDVTMKTPPFSLQPIGPFCFAQPDLTMFIGVECGNCSPQNRHLSLNVNRPTLDHS